MTDLTPLDVRKKRGGFHRHRKGYDAEEVDAFLARAAESFEKLAKEKLALSDLVSRLERELGALKEREKAIQDALVTAHKVRDEMIAQSQQDVEAIRAEAAREAERITTEAAREGERITGEAEAALAGRLAKIDDLILERRRTLEELEESRVRFLDSFRGLLERELEVVRVQASKRPLEDSTLDLELGERIPAAEASEEEPEAEGIAEPLEGKPEPKGAAEPPEEEPVTEQAGEPLQEEPRMEGAGGPRGELATPAAGLVQLEKEDASGEAEALDVGVGWMQGEDAEEVWGEVVPAEVVENTLGEGDAATGERVASAEDDKGAGGAEAEQKKGRVAPKKNEVA